LLKLLLKGYYRLDVLRKIFPLLVVVVLIFGCMPEQIPKEALQLTEESAARRSLETRRFETKDEQALLDAAAGIVKDLGFTIDATSKELGLIAGSKKESPFNIGGMATSAAVAVISSALSFPTSMPYSKDQMIRVSVVTRLAEGGNSTAVRVTFQRVVWDTEGKVAKSELLEGPAEYQAFFEKLAKALALDAHES
jgi:hypothetical protein